MGKLMNAVAATCTALLCFAAPAQATLARAAVLPDTIRVTAPLTTPGYGEDCIMPSISTCRLLPDADGPHMVQRWCSGQGWISVFAVCRSQFGPYA